MDGAAWRGRLAHADPEKAGAWREQGELSGVYKRYMGEGIDKGKRERINMRGDFVSVN
jgi:hypothetical protein